MISFSADENDVKYANFKWKITCEKLTGSTIYKRLLSLSTIYIHLQTNIQLYNSDCNIYFLYYSQLST